MFELMRKQYVESYLVVDLILEIRKYGLMNNNDDFMKFLERGMEVQHCKSVMESGLCLNGLKRRA